MAGIKNHIQSYGLQIGKGFGDIEDPLARHAAFMAQEATPYCKGCGKQILDAEQDESGGTVDYKLEQQRQMCTRCYGEQMEKLRQLQAQKQEAKPEITDWEAYKKSFMRE